MRMKITEDFTPGDFMVSGMNDENGNPIESRDSAAGTALPSKLVVIVESTHTGVNRNKVEYTYNGLENSVGSWTDNYNKPVLLNHNPHSDNIGRVKNGEFCQSVIDSSKYCIKLTLEITNRDAIERFLDGRYKTFSIGGYTDSAKCSICGKDQITDGWCGHSRGRRYDGKEAYWTLGKMEYDEISVVNCPADVNAQAIDIKIVSDEPKGEDSLEDNDGQGAVKDMYDDIDTLLGIGEQEDATTGEETGEEATEPTDNGGQEDSTTVVTNDNVGDDRVELLEAAIAEKDLLISELQGEKQADQTTISKLQGELETKDAENQDLTSKLQIAQDENQSFIRQNVEYAKFAHKVLCEKLADMQILVGARKSEERDELIKEYSVLTTKRINEMSDELMTATPRIIERASVKNPSLVTDGESEESPNNAPQVKTLQDYEDAVSNYFRTKL